MHGLYGQQRAYGYRKLPPRGTAFPSSPMVTEKFYRTDLKALYVFIGVGEPGTTDGWFNLKHAQYAA